MSIKIFADTSSLEVIRSCEGNSIIGGYTTNPSIMRRQGVTDYPAFAQAAVNATSKPISFEVIADDFDEMERQARKLAAFGRNVYVKIPITNTRGQTSIPLINRLSLAGVKVNVTALTAREQVKGILAFAPMIVSIFAGRIADTGRNPCIHFMGPKIPGVEFLWASPREVLNIYQAELAGADIITCTPDLIMKYERFKAMDLDELSLMTVKQFYDDAQAAGLKL